MSTAVNDKDVCYSTGTDNFVWPFDWVNKEGGKFGLYITWVCTRLTCAATKGAW